MYAHPWLQTLHSGVQYPVSGTLSSFRISPPQRVQAVQIWGKKKASLFCFASYIPTGCCSLKSTAASLWGKQARPPGFKFVLYGWPKIHPKNSLTSQINYQQARSTSTLSTCLFCINTRILFFFLFAICIFNQLPIIPVLENIAWKKKRVQRNFAFYCRTNTLSGVIQRPSPLGPPRRTFPVFTDLFSYFLWPKRSLKSVCIDKVHSAHYPLFPWEWQ